MTGIELELLTDYDMHLFIEKGLRGGNSMIAHRYAKANNKYIPSTYDNTKESSYIIYEDANNLYGYAMFKNFHIKILNGKIIILLKMISLILMLKMTMVIFLKLI